MLRGAPHPYDVALAFLVRMAVENATLAKWLATVNVSGAPKESLKEVASEYERFAQEEAERTGMGFVDTEEVTDRLSEEMTSAASSPYALEAMIEMLDDLLCDPTNATREEYEVFMTEEKFGLLIRNVMRCVLHGRFEDLCRLYEGLVVFVQGGDVEGGDESIMNISRISRITRTSDTYFSRMDISGIMVSPSKFASKPLASKGHHSGDDFRIGVLSKETRASIDKIHVFYDHASRRMTQLLPPSHPLVESLTNDGHPNRKAVYMQHAVLELGILHNQLGNKHEALLAAREAVAVSQQNMDESTLEPSLELFRRLEGDVTIAGFRSSNTDQNRLEVVVDAMQGSSSFIRSKNILRELDEIRDPTFVSKKLLLRSDVWEHFGHTPLAMAWTHGVAEGESSSLMDRLIAMTRQAMALASGGLKMHSSVRQNPLEKMQQVLLNLEFVQDGSIETDPVKREIVNLDPFIDATLRLVHSQLIASKCWSEAQQVRLAFLAMRGVESNEVLTTVDIIAGRMHAAFNRINGSPSSNSVTEADRLLKLARVSTKNQALIFALRAWALARDLQLRTLCALALVQAARGRFETGEYRGAVDLLRKALPHLTAHGPLDGLREAQLLDIKCRIKTLGVDDAVSKLEGLLKEMREDRDVPFAQMYFEEAFYLLALGYDQQGRVKERDKASEAFLALNGKHSIDPKPAIALAMQAVAMASKAASISCESLVS